MHRAKVSFTAPAGGATYTITRGQALPDDHPLVEAFPDNFIADTVIEDTTARPGKKRRL